MGDLSFQSPPTRAVILAAGRGNRLRPYTDQTPKPLLAIDNQTMLESVFLALQETNVRDVCLVVNHLAETIKAFAGNGKKWRLNITFTDQQAPLGTADAARSATHFITDTCYILAADYALPRHFLADLRDAYITQSCPLFASLKTLSQEELNQKSSVRFDHNGRITEIVEKPALGQAPSSIGAAPFLIVPPQIVQFLSNLTPSIRGEYELIDVLNNMIRHGYSMSGYLQPQPPEWHVPA